MLLDREIDQVALVDDEPDARRAYRMTIEDADLEAIEVINPMSSVNQGIAAIGESAQAVLCDHNLRKRNYATFDGAEFVARCYQRNIPAVLCTQYERPDVEVIRSYRSQIPVLLKSDEVEPDHLIAGLKTCIDELRNGPGDQRRLWRTQVRVVDEGEPGRGVFFVVVPAWGRDERIGVRISDIPNAVRDSLAEGRRYHVQANIGAESADELFFGNWETE